MKRPAVIVDRNKQTNKTKNKQTKKKPNKKQQQNVHVTLK